MCRLFAMHAGADPVKATFWLLTAPDSLAQQSRREADGFGIGAYDREGRPVVEKAPIAAYEDKQFAAEARDLESITFLAHVRYASTGGELKVNTHPFEQDNRLLAHNGVVEDLDRLDVRLRQLGVMDLVKGETDSERVFALITAEARSNGGDVDAAIASALSWVAENLRLFALNIIVTTAADLWAVRYPDTHPLYVLELSADDPHSGMTTQRISVRSQELSDKQRPAVLLATEKMDDNPNWRLMNSGELLHIKPSLQIETSYPLPPSPRHRLTLADLNDRAAASQRPLKAGSVP
ncbi:class II glutamine amidotransferase [Arthrobacter sp. zg-Y820]|uniref:class II glutamine amidotransferase n=1 Tax=unclassified Arthrobacter TaxID=235627 RepID=UPI0022B086FE|nr:MULTISPECIES: class II glutamine amidotransferase [unclassified Arthrobacter]MDK1281183.1 class II glutamine amidotransferase [Arthrobacter sp. zg.Y820]WIB09774.1 class II glutamine amidotransferase [Arthrobacter sp. zg-Y820]